MAKAFDYKEIDAEGHETLATIEAANNFNKWMYNTIAPFCEGKTLEIGSGTGNISKYFLADRKPICLSDIRDNYCDILRAKFESDKNLIDVINLDLVNVDFDRVYAQYIGWFDTVFALNVVEHIDNDKLAVANCKKLLRAGGTLIILVPAYQWLYNGFDRELYHFRRYTRKGLSTLFKVNDIQLIKVFNFNLVGILGWFFSGTILKNKIIPSEQMGLYNKLVPVIKFFDKIALKRIGLSVIAVGKK